MPDPQAQDPSSGRTYFPSIIAGAPPPPPIALRGEGAIEKGTPVSWGDLIEAEARRQGVHPALARAVAETESSLNPDAHSRAGAHGLMQLMPETAKHWGVDPTDPYENIKGGVSELKQLLAEHNGDITAALRGYNASPHAPLSATDPYVQKVLAKLEAQATPSTSTATPTAVGEPPPAPEETWGQWGKRQAKEMGAAVDPRTPMGRRNLAGGAGAALATGAIVSSAPVSVPIAGLTALAAGTLGAVGGGMTAEAGEQLVGTAPPSGEAVVGAGAQQGAYEVTGQALLHGVLNPIGRQLIKSTVGKYASRALVSASEALSASKQALLDRLGQGLQAAQRLVPATRTAARQATTAAAEASHQGIQAAQALTERNVGTAETLAQQGVTGAEAQRAAAEVAARAQYEATRVGGPPPMRPVASHVTEPPTGPEAAGNAAMRAEAAGGGPAYRDPTAQASGRALERRVQTGRGPGGTERRAAPAAVAVGMPPPSPAEAGRRVVHVAFGEGGGAKVARDLAGQAVEQAAASGPPINKAPLLKELDRLSESITPTAATAHDATQAWVEVGGRHMPLSEAQARYGATAADVVGGLPPDHPLPAVLNRVRGMLHEGGDTISFSDAHKIKRLLDDAVNWQSPARKQAQQIAKGFRQTLRSLMEGHAPYDRATAHYAAIAPLYGKGSVAAGVRSVIQTNPERVVNLVAPSLRATASRATAAGQLVHLLTTQAEAGGGVEEGRAALQAVQAAWIHQKVIAGGVEHLSDRIAAIDPVFRDAFLGDAHAREILDNLHLISRAYEAAVSTEAVQAAKATGKAGVEAAGELGAQRVGAAREAGRTAVIGTREAGAQAVERAQAGATAAEQALTAGKVGIRGQERALAEKAVALKGSTLGRSKWADLLRAVVLLPKGSIWGAISTVRLMEGSTARDLITWASASPASTQLLVKALTSTTPALALSDLVRTSGILEDDLGTEPPMAVSHAPTSVGAPPPAPPPARAASPSPTPTPTPTPAPTAEAAPAPADWSSKIVNGRVTVTSPTGKVYYAPDQATADRAIAAAKAQAGGGQR